MHSGKIRGTGQELLQVVSFIHHHLKDKQALPSIACILFDRNGSMQYTGGEVHSYSVPTHAICTALDFFNDKSTQKLYLQDFAASSFHSSFQVYIPAMAITNIQHLGGRSSKRVNYNDFSINFICFFLYILKLLGLFIFYIYIDTTDFFQHN